jgi:AcrR family transcriptional regulator
MKNKDLRSARERLRRQENRETILHAAEAVILRKGFRATSMDDVAAQAQFSKATLYHYFKSKAELIFEILIHFLEEVDRQIRTIRAQDKSAREKLLESIRYSVRFQAEKENVTRVFMMDRSFLKLMHTFVADKSRPPSDAEKRFIQKIKAKRKAIMDGAAGIVREGIETGEFRAVDPQAAATFIAAATLGYFHEKFWNEKKPDTEKDVYTMCEIILHGIVNKEA